jgi:RHS repeat-associated protein
LTTQTTTYAFNSENQLVGLNKPNGESWTYKYDRPGRRIEKSSGTAPSQITRFVHDGDNILAILDGDNEPRQVFTNGLNIDEPLSMRSNSGVERYFLADALGSVRALTSTSATIVETYDYESYGKPVVKDAGGSTITVAQSENRLLYTARYYDEEGDHQETRNRTYDWEVGAFISEDPLQLISDFHSAYAYARNSSINGRDPYGLIRDDAPWDTPNSNDSAGPGEYLMSMYKYAHKIRSELRSRYDAPEYDSLRHCAATCALSTAYGTTSARIAGAANEMQGIAIDLRHLQTGAFELLDFRRNEVGVACSRAVDAHLSREQQVSRCVTLCSQTKLP